MATPEVTPHASESTGLAKLHAVVQVVRGGRAFNVAAEEHKQLSRSLKEKLALRERLENERQKEDRERRQLRKEASTKIPDLQARLEAGGELPTAEQFALLEELHALMQLVSEWEAETERIRQKRELEDEKTRLTKDEERILRGQEAQRRERENRRGPTRVDLGPRKLSTPLPRTDSSEDNILRSEAVQIAEPSEIATHVELRKPVEVPPKPQLPTLQVKLDFEILERLAALIPGSAVVPSEICIVFSKATPAESVKTLGLSELLAALQPRPAPLEGVENAEQVKLNHSQELSPIASLPPSERSQSHRTRRLPLPSQSTQSWRPKLKSVSPSRSVTEEDVPRSSRRPFYDALLSMPPGREFALQLRYRTNLAQPEHFWPVRDRLLSSLPHDRLWRLNCEHTRDDGGRSCAEVAITSAFIRGRAGQLAVCSMLQQLSEIQRALDLVPWKLRITVSASGLAFPTVRATAINFLLYENALDLVFQNDPAVDFRKLRNCQAGLSLEEQCTTWMRAVTVAQLQQELRFEGADKEPVKFEPYMEISEEQGIPMFHFNYLPVEAISCWQVQPWLCFVLLMCDGSCRSTWEQQRSLAARYTRSKAAPVEVFYDCFNNVIRHAGLYQLMRSRLPAATRKRLRVTFGAKDEYQSPVPERTASPNQQSTALQLAPLRLSCQDNSAIDKYAVPLPEKSRGTARRRRRQQPAARSGEALPLLATPQLAYCWPDTGHFENSVLGALFEL